MSNVVRFDADSWLTDGAVLFGEGGFGVLAETIPADGEGGAGYCYNDLDLPTDNGKEICGRITSWPAAGTLTAFEDTSFTFTGAPDGTYSFQYQLYVDGVATGSPATVTLTVGDGNIACALGTATASGHQATVSGAENIACALGTATASGHPAALTEGIDCTTGTATASGHAAAIQANDVIACALGTATAAGHQAAIGGGLVSNERFIAAAAARNYTTTDAVRDYRAAAAARNYEVRPS